MLNKLKTIKGIKMRFLLIINIVAIICHSLAWAQSSPFSLITVTGETNTRFNSVSLFENGSSAVPLKTQSVSEYDGQYNIDINIPGDMQKKGNYYFTDMRFWSDKNGNGIREEGDTSSECHFIMWVPSTNQLYMQVYNGPKYPIDSSVLYYHYKK